MIYLASPYSHPHPQVREARFESACRATAGLVRTGHVVFSPIIHGHPLTRYGLPSDWPYWEPHDREHLSRCDEVVVLRLEGWRESEGIQGELAIAAALGKPVRYIDAVGANEKTPVEAGALAEL
jgi:nucleoside 2-deoxyribosyltransferase